MLIITLPTTLIQIFYEMILNFQFIVQGFKDPDDSVKSIS